MVALICANSYEFVRNRANHATGGIIVTIYEIQNAQKAPIWKQRIIECRSSGKSVKEWCKEHSLDFTTYYRWERKILANIIPAEDFPGSDLPALPGTNHPTVPKESNAIVKVELATDSENQENIHFSVNGFDFCVQANVSCEFLTKLLEATKHAG